MSLKPLSDQEIFELIWLLIRLYTDKDADNSDSMDVFELCDDVLHRRKWRRENTNLPDPE